MYDVIIIGGGASGLTVANVAKSRGKSVVVLEANKRAGRKILLAGNGRCNVSNEVISSEYYNNDKIAKFLSKSGKVRDFFDRIGLEVRSVDGRLYPYSETGTTVLNLLRKNLSDEIICDVVVDEINYCDGVFNVNGYEAKKAVVCTGGVASGGIDSYSLLQKFGHTKTKLYPALCPMYCDSKYTKSLAGIRVKANLSLFTDGRKIYSEKGELLFKENGLSGIVSMSLSRYLSDGDNEVSIDFAPEYDRARLEKISADGLLQSAVLTCVTKQASDRNLSVAEVIKDFRVKKVRYGDMKNAQTTRGGIATDTFTDCLESKFRHGLYACGEVLDVDGACGGYNLHWAFLSGIIVGESV